MTPHIIATKIIQTDISAINEYAKNSRTHSLHHIDQLVESIREFGFTNPILIDETSTILAGHGRLAAAKKLGIKTVPTITISGLTDLQKKAYVIADNKLALNSGWDIDLLASELKDLAEMDFNVDIIGFDADELSALFIPEPEDDETEEKDKQEKFMLEIQFADKETMFAKYEDLLSEGLIVRYKNG